MSYEDKILSSIPRSDEDAVFGEEDLEETPAETEEPKEEEEEEELEI